MAVTQAPLMACTNLNVAYGDTPVLQSISFTLTPGKFYGLLGRNGSGKTTLIHCLNRTRDPNGGTIAIGGKDIATLSPKTLAGQVSLVPQEHVDVFPFTVLDMVVMGRAPHLGLIQRPGVEDYETATQALESLNAGHLADKNFNRISGGERQISLLARALAQSTKIILLDEPCNHLDFNNQFRLLSTISALCHNRGITVLAAMHDPNTTALFADEVIMLKNCTILSKGPVNTVMTQETMSTLYDTPISAIPLDQGRDLFFPDTIRKGPQ